MHQQYDIPATIKDTIIPGIKRRLNNPAKHECTMWVMDGDRGMGKTTAALEIQREYDKGFNIKGQTSYEYSEIISREMQDIPKGKGHHIDEIRFDRVDIRTTQGVMIKKVIKEIRPFSHFITLTTPDIHDVMDVFLDYADYYSFFTEEGTMLLLEKNPMIIKGNKFGLSPRDFPKINDKMSFNRYFVKPALRARTLIGEFKFPQYTSRFTARDYNNYHALRISKSTTLGLEPPRSKKEEQLTRRVNKLEARQDRVFSSAVNMLTVVERMRLFGIGRKTEFNWRTRLGLVNGNGQLDIDNTLGG